MEQAPEVKQPKKMNRLSKLQKAKMKVIIMENTQNFGTPAARCKVTDKELGKIITDQLNFPVSTLTANHWRNKEKVKPARTSKEFVERTHVRKARKSSRRGACGSIDNVLVMNTAKILKVLKKIARKLHAI